MSKQRREDVNLRWGSLALSLSMQSLIEAIVLGKPSTVRASYNRHK